MSRPVRSIAVIAVIAALAVAGAFGLFSSTSTSHSLRAIDCVIVNVNTGPVHQAVEICPPVAANPGL